MASPPGSRQQGVFTTGSTMRHVAVMTSTASVGLMAIFAVDLANIFYISLLGERELAAAIGYAGTVLFFATSVCIGIAIAGTALVSRQLGAGERAEARRLAASALVFMLVASVLLVILALPLLGPLLTLLGAEGNTHALAQRFLLFVLPATPLLGLGMILSAFLRAAGDARRAMGVTLSGGVATAILDPILIFGFELGLDGAAIASILSRMVLALVGLYGAVRVNDLVARPRLAQTLRHLTAIWAIALPAVLTNVATPVGNAFVTRSIAEFGDSAVAGWAVIGRLIPFAFGFLFALSGAVGPIVGQNFGAQRFDRVRRTLRDAQMLTLAYTLVVWALLAACNQLIVAAFGISGPAGELVSFFCLFVAGGFVFNGMLFVANAAFNNLGFAGYSTLFNWGRATLGTIPLVWLGAMVLGAPGALLGQAFGGLVFGVLAVIVAFRVIARLEKGESGDDVPPRAGMAVPAFSTGKSATAG